MKNNKIQIIVNAVDNASKNLKAISSKMTDFAEKNRKTFKKMSITGTAALAGITAGSIKAVNAFGKFESGMSNVSTLVDTATESISDMSKEVLQIAKRTPKPIEELTEGLYNIRSAGVSAGDAMMVLEKSAELATAGLGQTTEAVDLSTSAINAFGLKGKRAEKAFETIFLTVKSGKTTVAELAQSFGMVAGTAATAGIEFDELMAATAALTTTGLKASVAQTQLRSATLSIIAPTTDMTKALKELNIEGVKTGEDLIAKRGLVGAMQALYEGADGNVEQLKKMFGSVEALNAVLSLAGEQGESFATTMEAMKNSSGALDEAFAKQNETYGALKQRFSNTVEVMTVSIGKSLLPVITELMKKLSPMITKITTWIEKNPELTKNIILVSGAVAGLTAGLGMVGLVIPNVIVGVGLLSKALMFLALNPVGAIITGITGIIATSIYLYKNWDKVTAGIKIIRGQFSEWFSGMTQRIGGFFSGVWNRMPGRAKTALQGVATIITGPLGAIARLFSRRGQGLIRSSGSIGGGIKNVFSSIFGGIKNAAISFVNYVIDKINSVIEAINRVGGAVGINIGKLNRLGTSIQGATAHKNYQTMLTNNNRASAIRSHFANRAIGGPVTAGVPYKVGELGPEVFVPSTGGRIEKQSTQSDIHIHIGDVSINDGTDLDSFVDIIKQTVYNETRRAQRGLYAS